MTIRTFRPLRRAVAAGLVAAGLLGGCSDDTGPAESEIFSVRLALGDRTVTIDRGGDVAGGPATVPANTDVAVTGTFLDDAGRAVPTAGTVELQIESADLAVAYIPSGSTTGTLRADEGGPYEITVQVRDEAADATLFDETVTLLVEAPLD